MVASAGEEDRTSLNDEPALMVKYHFCHECGIETARSLACYDRRDGQGGRYAGAAPLFSRRCSLDR